MAFVFSVCYTYIHALTNCKSCFIFDVTISMWFSTCCKLGSWLGSVSGAEEVVCHVLNVVVVEVKVDVRRLASARSHRPNSRQLLLAYSQSHLLAVV